MIVILSVQIKVQMQELQEVFICPSSKYHPRWWDLLCVMMWSKFLAIGSGWGSLQLVHFCKSQQLPFQSVEIGVEMQNL